VDSFGVFGLIAFVLVMCYMGLPSDIKKLKQEIKKVKGSLNIINKGESSMSKMLEELKNQKCRILFTNVMDFGSNKIECIVLDVEEEWIKITFKDKKGENIIKIIRVEKVSEVEIMQ